MPTEFRTTILLVAAALVVGANVLMANRKKVPRPLFSFTLGAAFIASFPLFFYLVRVSGPRTGAQAMVDKSFVADRKQPYSVGITAREWEGLYRHPIHNPVAGVPEIPPDRLVVAVAESIRKSGVFASVAPEDPAFRLEVVIMKVNVPWHFIPTTRTKVDVVLSWRLTDASRQHVMFEELILTSHTATMHDSIGEPKRAQMAVEAATRENIRKGIGRLSRLNLSP